MHAEKVSRPAGGRRDFLKASAFLGTVSAMAPARALPREKPSLRIAVVSDLQGLPYPENAGMRNLERALDIFAPLKPDVVVSAGDMNDTGRDEAAVAWFKARCDARLGVLPHVACIGNHELAFVPASERAARTSAVCRKEFCSIFGDPPELVIRKTIGGYDFISLSLDDSECYHEPELAALARELKAAVARDGAKPIFVVSHYHPFDTVNDSRTKRSGRLREILAPYPQVISLSGHTHCPLQDPRSIWQGAFTAIETSTLCYGCLLNQPPAANQISCLLPYGHESVGCLFIEVYAGRVLVRRFSVRDRQEIDPLSPWEIAWPYRPSQARYSFAAQRAREVPPRFEGDPELSLWYDFGYLYLMWNAVADPARVYSYRVELTDASGETKTYHHQADYYRIAAHRQQRVVFKFPPHSVVAGGTYRCRVVPIGFFGTEGQKIDWTFTVEAGYPCRNDIPNFVQE